MLHDTKAPTFGNRIHTALLAIHLRDAYQDDGKSTDRPEQMMTIRGLDHPKMVIDGFGTARFIRDREGMAYSGHGRHVYISKKKWHITNPHERSYSDLVDFYFKAGRIEPEEE